MDPVEPTSDPFAPLRPVGVNGGPTGSATPPAAAGPSFLPPPDARAAVVQPGDWLPPATEPVPMPEPAGKRSMGGRVAAIAGAVVIGAGTVIGVHFATSHDTTAAANGRLGGPGGGGQFGGPGGFGRGGGVVGTLASVNGSTLTLTTRNGGSVTVDTSSSTSVTKTATGAVGDIKAGDHVQVRGGSSGTNSITALEVTDSGSIDAFGRPGGAAGPGRGAANGNGQASGGFGGRGSFPGPNGNGGRFGMAVDGIVSSVTADALAIKDMSGTTVTATTSGETRVIRLEASSVKALTIGETLRVTGTTGSNGTVTATAIEAGDAGFGGFGGFRPDGGLGAGGNAAGSAAGNAGSTGNAGSGSAPPAPFGLSPNPGS